MSLLEAGIEKFVKNETFREQLIKEYKKDIEQKEEKRKLCIENYKSDKDGRCWNFSCGVFSSDKDKKWVKEHGCDYFSILEIMGYDIGDKNGKKDDSTR